MSLPVNAVLVFTCAPPVDAVNHPMNCMLVLACVGVGRDDSFPSVSVVPLVGVTDHVEIWDEAAWNAYNDENDLTEILGELQDVNL